MADIKTLEGREAVEKIKELAEDKVCMFCTYEDYKMVSRPMATSGVDDDGTVWFLSKRGSDKNDQLDSNHGVDLICMDAGKQQYLVLSGYADVVYNKDKAKELWTPLAKAWFEKGLDDPELAMIKIIPAEGHYWDTKNGKLISILKIAAAAVTGKKMDGGVEGDLLP